MLFDLTANTNSRKIMTLDPNFPEDVMTTVIKGNTVDATFTAKIAEHGKPAEYAYQWYVNDLPIPGATGDSYTLTGLGETVTSTVFCEVTNKKGTVRTRTATLNVEQYYTPVLNSSYPQNVTVDKGTSVTCKVEIDTEGNPDSYTYQWYKNGSAVSGATSSTYTFAPSATGDSTVYCKVSNSAGTVTSRTATITALVYLLKSGQISSLAGDIAGKGGNAHSTSGLVPATPTITKQTTQIRIRQATGSRSGYVYFTKKVNLSSYNAISIDVLSETPSSGGSGPTFLCWKNLPTYWSADAAANRSVKTDGVRKIVGKDISALSGEYYLGFGIGSSDNEENTIWVYNMFLK